MQLVLASQSPRRKELLGLLGRDFITLPVDADETIPPGTPPAEAVEMLAQRKARMAASQRPGDLIVAADTVVAIDGMILGKPHSAQEAAAMLKRLSGRLHSVYTGVCVRYGEKERSFVAHTQVEFYPMEEGEIRWYLETGEPFDKAGAYGIQGYGAVFVKGIIGDYYNVMGLPIARLRRELESLEQE